MWILKAPNGRECSRTVSRHRHIQCTIIQWKHHPCRGHLNHIRALKNNSKLKIDRLLIILPQITKKLQRLLCSIKTMYSLIQLQWNQWVAIWIQRQHYILLHNTPVFLMEQATVSNYPVPSAFDPWILHTLPTLSRLDSTEGVLFADQVTQNFFIPNFFIKVGEGARFFCIKLHWI